MPWDTSGGSSINPEHEDRLIASQTHPERPALVESSAHHEASHAVAAVALNIRFDYVELSAYQWTSKPGSNLGGVIFDELHPDRPPDFEPGNPVHQQTLERWVVVALAGEAGESFLEERACDILRWSAEGDYKAAMRWGKLLHADPRACDAWIEEQERVACNLVREPLRERQISAVANHLKVKRELTYAAVCRIMEDIQVSEDDLAFHITNDE